MTDHRQALLTQLQEQFADALLSAEIVHREITIETLAEHISPLCQTLRDEFGFEQLMDLCGIDYSTYGQADWDTQQATRSGFSRGVSPAIHQEKPKHDSRFAVVYHLLSIQHNQRLRIRAFIEQEPLKIDSVIPIWNVANWFEREAFDLYGILFEGHPDLRRILTDYGFIGHPFRKDFPISGNVEMRYDPQKKRVVYEPVSIEPRVLVPRVIRDDNRYAKN
jgi:NADH-quinone oxidoreductase subunit C